MKFLKIFICISLFSTPLHAKYKNVHLIKAFKEFKLAKYSDALDSLKKIRSPRKVLATRYYLEGLIQNRLQQYDQAAESFKKSLQKKHKADDLHYEYGQALYANNELLRSRDAFSQSFEKGFKEESSLYYMAHISQLLEEHKKARDFYSKLIKMSKNDKKMQQIARFQLSESFLALAENRDDSARLVDKYVLPALNQAFSTLPDGKLAKDIEKRRKEIQRQYGLDPNIMENGRVLQEQRFSARFRHQISRDSNITLATDVPTAASLQKDTFIHETNFNFQYLFAHKKRFTFTPFFRFRNVYHTEREDSTVFKNDTYNMTMGSRNTYEHSAFGKQANLLYDLEYVYIGRDAQGIKEKNFFSRAWTFTVGERFRFFSFGPTTVKFAYKDYRAYTETLFNKTKTISVDQIKSTSWGHLFIFLLRADFIDTYNNSSTSTNNFIFRTDYLWPEIWPTYTLTATMSLSALDTKEQSATRGTEKTIAPSIEIKKAFGKRISATLGFDYTKNISKDKNSFDYKKNVVRFEVSASY